MAERPGRLRIVTDSAEALNRFLDELVSLGIVDEGSIRRRQLGRGSFVAYARLTPEFS